jgi:hypothetical protein
VQSLVRVTGDEGRPGDHVRRRHFVEQVPRIPREPATQRKVRQGSGQDGGGREAELEEHRVEGPHVGRGASDRRGLERAGQGGGVPYGARARQRRARTRHVAKSVAGRQGVWRRRSCTDEGQRTGGAAGVAGGRAGNAVPPRRGRRRSSTRPAASPRRRRAPEGRRRRCSSLARLRRCPRAGPGPVASVLQLDLEVVLNKF